jgi:hypothetical protein
MARKCEIFGRVFDGGYMLMYSAYSAMPAREMPGLKPFESKKAYAPPPTPPHAYEPDMTRPSIE